jgi:hypothetical protein
VSVGVACFSSQYNFAEAVCCWPNPDDGIQDNSLLICKTYEFSLQTEAACRRSRESGRPCFRSTPTQYGFPLSREVISASGGNDGYWPKSATFTKKSSIAGIAESYRSLFCFKFLFNKRQETLNDKPSSEPAISADNDSILGPMEESNRE